MCYIYRTGYLEWLREVPCKRTSDMHHLPITENSVAPQGDLIRNGMECMALSCGLVGSYELCEPPQHVACDA